MEPNTTDATARPLRVVRLYYHLDVGGIESRLVDLLPRLDRRRFEVQLVCTRRRGRLARTMEERGVPVRLCPYVDRLPMALAIWPMTRLLRRSRADIVHAHGEALAQAATVAAAKAGVPIVVANFHNVTLFQREDQLELERSQSAARGAVIHVSKRAHKDYMERVRPAEDRGVVLYNGVDVDRFAAPLPDERRSSLLRELELESRGPLLLNVARLHRDKAHEVLFEAFAVIRETHAGATLLLVGDGRRGDELRALVRNLGLENAVRFLGVRGDTRDLYHLADVNVLASNREGFSNVVLEAMAAGVPQVLTDVGGNREAVGDDHAALLIPPRDPAALAQAVLSLLSDPEMAGRIGGAARERVTAFRVEQQVRETEQLYHELARRKGLI